MNTVHETTPVMYTLKAQCLAWLTQERFYVTAIKILLR